MEQRHEAAAAAATETERKRAHAEASYREAEDALYREVRMGKSDATISGLVESTGVYWRDVSTAVLCTRTWKRLEVAPPRCTLPLIRWISLLVVRMALPQGYQLGVSQTLSKLDDQLDKQARVAFADAAREEERARGALVARELARLMETQYRCVYVGVASVNSISLFTRGVACPQTGQKILALLAPLTWQHIGTNHWFWLLGSLQATASCARVPGAGGCSVGVRPQTRRTAVRGRRVCVCALRRCSAGGAHEPRCRDEAAAATIAGRDLSTYALMRM